MSEWRINGSPCPSDPSAKASLGLCLGCPYNRGASSYIRLALLCNWPRNGSYIATDHRMPVPDYVLRSYEDAAPWDESFEEKP